ncbi:MAG: hypothetical protein JRI23_00770 [Deltaproteobacteria bacterium]|jgi:hypothetical protein|nr:hypothetical protein [Deltaproteobacteria bacterium]MBW2529982.1 hypothetical protein [Deltaproteobacteria bacterium]
MRSIDHRGKRTYAAAWLGLLAAAAAPALTSCGNDCADHATPTTVVAAAGQGGSGGGGGEEGGVGGAPSACAPADCAGCCLPDGSCAPGTSNDACGYDGWSCADCTVTARSCRDNVCVNAARLPDGLVDDRLMYVQSDDDALRMRRDLIRFVWGDDGYPTALPSSVSQGVASPDPTLVGFDRVDELRITMDMGFVSVAHLLHPPAQVANDRLVVFHQGHSDGLGPNGGTETINTLLAAGFAVLGVQMPLYGDNDGPVADHNEIMALADDSLGYDPMRFFLEPVLVALNHTRQSQGYADESMIGISGGGWTTTLIAAIDPRIQCAFPAAGSTPFWTRAPWDRGDAEQTHERFYEIGGYADLYVLGSTGGVRRHVQLLNRYDECCFAGLAYRQYEGMVAGQVDALAEGSFRVFLDESHPFHQISIHALEAAVLPELAGGAVRYLDDTAPDYGIFRTVGTWTATTGTGFGGTVQIAPASTAIFRAWWELPVEPGTYRVAATWVAEPSRATDATYDITGAGSVVVDQQQAPVGFAEAGATWQVLAPAVVVTGSILRARLNNGTDGSVAADAVRIERIGS